MLESNWFCFLIGIIIGVIVGGSVVGVIGYCRYKRMKELAHRHMRYRMFLDSWCKNLKNKVDTKCLLCFYLNVIPEIPVSV